MSTLSTTIENHANIDSLPTQQYRCYFNQGPLGPPFTGPEEDCSGPTADVQGGITAA
jgi:hypothetical protein